MKLYIFYADDGRITGTLLSVQPPQGRTWLNVSPSTQWQGKMVDLATLELVDAPPHEQLPEEAPPAE